MEGFMWSERRKERREEKGKKGRSNWRRDRETGFSLIQNSSSGLRNLSHLMFRSRLN